MSESSSAIRNGLEVLGVGVLVGLFDGPEWHSGMGYLSGGRTLLTCSREGAWPRTLQRTRKQAGRQRTALTGASS